MGIHAVGKQRIRPAVPTAPTGILRHGRDFFANVPSQLTVGLVLSPAHARAYLNSGAAFIGSLVMLVVSRALSEVERFGFSRLAVAPVVVEAALFAAFDGAADAAVVAAVGVAVS